MNLLLSLVLILSMTGIVRNSDSRVHLAGHETGVSESTFLAANGEGITGMQMNSGTGNQSEVTRVYFKDLRRFRMGDDKPPADIEVLNGKSVAIVGYMVPFDSIENIEKFVLLQAPFMGCYHVPPPQPNESLMVFSGNQRVDFTYEPILITGILEVEESYVESYLVSKYTIRSASVRRAEMSDAELDGLPLNFHFGGDF
jgi:hypothetical protein